MLFKCRYSFELILKSTMVQCTHMSSFSRLSERYQRFWSRDVLPPNPPYKHICQIGDPILRSKAEEVLPEFIKTPEIQQVVAALKVAIKHYKAVGICAPQIGVPLRIILIQFSEATLAEFSPEIRENREMHVCPPTVIFNPIIKIINPYRVIFPEGCQSISGFSASVARHHEIRVSGLGEKAEAIDWQVKGWLARIIQHEVDHLNGVLVTDIMDPKTLQFDSWYIVNQSQGKCRHTFF